MPKNIFLPLLGLNAVYVLMLVTLGPRYGWTVMIVAGAFVTMVNLLAVRACSTPPRRS